MTKAEKIEVPQGNVHARLSEARQRFHALELKKSGKNSFAGYNYFELSDFVIPALQVFHDCGLSAVISFDPDIAAMAIVNIDKPEETIVIRSPMGSASLKGCHEVQNIGAVETYQRRYLWMAALEIVEHDALDAGGAVEETPAELSEDKRVKIVQLCEAVGDDQAGKICKAYKVQAITELTPKQADAVIGKLNDKLSAMAKAETDRELANG